MPKIYERNPDTGEIREYERTPEPKPYRNEMAEAVEILARMERKIDALIFWIFLLTAVLFFNIMYL